VPQPFITKLKKTVIEDVAFQLARPNIPLARERLGSKAQQNTQPRLQVGL